MIQKKEIEASKIDVLEDIKKVQSVIGRKPTRNEYRELGKYSSSIIEKIFGSYTQAIEVASPENQSENNKFERIEEGDYVALTLHSYEIKTVEELIEYAEVDLDEYEVTKKVVNVWGNGDNPCYQVKAWLTKKKVTQVNVKDLIESFEKNVKTFEPKHKSIKRPKLKESNLLEISCPDLHFGELAWNEETGFDNYDIKIAEKVMLDAIEYFIEKSKQFNFDKILFPIGSDFFNVNNSLNTTLAGTSQDEDCRWQKSFDKGVMLLVKSIELLKKIADVDVEVIYGNHDHERAYYAGSYLSAWYRNSKNVNINNKPTIRKYYKYNENLIGLTHGHSIKMHRLPLIMASEAADMWSTTKFREWHIGHLHHKQSHVYNTDLEENGIRVKILPSLVAVDAWHSLKGYNSIREAQAFIWHKNKGNIAQFNYHI